MRSIWVTLILGSLVVANVWRAWGFYMQSAVLRERNAIVDPTILMGAAVVWAIIFFGLMLCVLRQMAFVKWLVPLLLLVYAGWMAVRPTPTFPLLIWHLALAGFTGWRLNQKRGDAATPPL